MRHTKKSLQKLENGLKWVIKLDNRTTIRVKTDSQRDRWLELYPRATCQDIKTGKPYTPPKTGEE